MPLMFYPLIAMVIPAVASLILFYRIKRDSIIITKSFFWDYAFGFAILSMVNLAPFFINLGVQISYDALLILYTVSFFAVLFAYSLFYRGTIALMTKNAFFTTVIPFIAFPFFSFSTIISLFILKIKTYLLYTVGVWTFLFPLDAFLGSLFLYFFIKGAPFDRGKKRKPCMLLMSSAWFLLLALEVVLWYNVAVYPAPEFWIMKIASMDYWFLARAAAYLMLLVGSLLYSRRLEHVEMVEKVAG